MKFHLPTATEFQHAIDQPLFNSVIPSSTLYEKQKSHQPPIKKSQPAPQRWKQPALAPLWFISIWTPLPATFQGSVSGLHFRDHDFHFLDPWQTAFRSASALFSASGAKIRRVKRTISRKPFVRTAGCRIFDCSRWLGHPRSHHRIR